MEMIQQPLAPPANGDLLGQQPILQFLDQYLNLCDSENTQIIRAVKNDDGNWNLQGTTELAAVNGIVSYTDLSAYSTEPISGAALRFNSDNIDPVFSNSFEIPDVANPPALTAADGATVDQPLRITFTEDSIWRNRVNIITVNDSILAKTAYQTTQEGELELIPAESEFLQKSKLNFLGKQAT